MNWLKFIIPLSITLGPHLTMLSLFELSSRSKSEHIEPVTSRTAHFLTLPLAQESSGPPFIAETDEEPKVPQPPSSSNPDLSSDKSSTQTISKTKISSQRAKNTRRQCSSSPYVSQDSGQSYTLDKKRFSHFLSSPKEANGLASLSWSTHKSGTTRGVRIKRIPCASPLRAMGLTPGMLITHINGKTITSNADLYKAYRAIKKSSSFSLSGKKQGQPIQRFYTVSTLKK